MDLSAGNEVLSGVQQIMPSVNRMSDNQVIEITESSESFEENDTLSNDNVSELGFVRREFRQSTFLDKSSSHMLDMKGNSSDIIHDQRSSHISHLRRGVSVIEKIDFDDQLEEGSAAEKALNFLKRKNKSNFYPPIKRTSSVLNNNFNELESFKNEILTSFINRKNNKEQNREFLTRNHVSNCLKFNKTLISYNITLYLQQIININNYC